MPLPRRRPTLASPTPSGWRQIGPCGTRPPTRRAASLLRSRAGSADRRSVERRPSGALRGSSSPSSPRAPAAVAAASTSWSPAPPPLGRRVALAPLLAAISRVAPGRAAPEGGFGHPPIRRLPLPLDALQLVVLGQARLPQRPEEAARLPLLEAPVRGAAAAQLL